MSHKIRDTKGKVIFEGSSEKCYEFILKLMSTNSDDYMMKYLNYKNGTEFKKAKKWIGVSRGFQTKIELRFGMW